MTNDLKKEEAQAKNNTLTTHDVQGENTKLSMHLMRNAQGLWDINIIKIIKRLRIYQTKQTFSITCKINKYIHFNLMMTAKQ